MVKGVDVQLKGRIKNNWFRMVKALLTIVTIDFPKKALWKTLLSRGIYVSRMEVDQP